MNLETRTDSSSVSLENTLGIPKKAKGILRPTSKGELKQYIIQANNDGEKLYAYSRGNNWGYGCNSPVEDNSIALDLSGLREIVHYDHQQGMITIEPGVTHGDLQKFLKSRGNRWICPVHGGGPDCSVLGNALERGYGITPIEDHFAALFSMKAILADGTEYESPLSSLNQIKLDHIFKWGIGPYLDGIFTQSNFAVVTEITIKLSALPQNIHMFNVRINHHDFAQVVDIISRLKASIGHNLSSINLMNKERVLSMMIDYPEELKDQNLPIPEADLNKEAKSLMVKDWTIIGSIYGPSAVVKGIKKTVKKEFSTLNTTVFFMTEKRLGYVKALSNFIPRIGKLDLKTQVETLQNVFDILKGIPNNTALKLAYWKRKGVLDKEVLNPREDGCGLIWYAPLVPLTPEKASRYVKMVKEISKKHEINSLITLTTISPDCFDSTIPILFDKESPEETAKAHAYMKELLEQGAIEGFYPYRLSIAHMSLLDEFKDRPYFDVAKKIKDCLDPKGTLSPGRYI